VFSEALAEESAVVFKNACAFGLEGIVSKREGSRYRSGPSDMAEDQEPLFRQDDVWRPTRRRPE
jgi:hypothetical protein